MSVIVIQKVTFDRPAIGPRHYISRGPSGMPETFLRVDADTELVKFLGNLELNDLINNFLDMIRIKQRPQSNWSDVINYLGRIMDMEPDNIPSVIGITFWAKVTIVETQKGTN